MRRANKYTSMKRQIAEKILEVLGRARFDDWYKTGNFDKYVTGEWRGTPEEDKERILKEIEQMFGL